MSDPVSTIYDLCSEGTYRDISALVRTVLAAELGVEYVCEPRIIYYENGVEHPYEDWRCRRDEAARY